MFSHLKIRTLLLFGFGTLVATTLIVAGCGYWGIDYLSRQTATISRLSINQKFIANAFTAENDIRDALISTRTEPTDAAQVTYTAAAEKLTASISEVNERSLSVERKKIYARILAQLPVQTQSAEKSFELGRNFVAARTRLLSAGDLLSAHTDKLVQDALETEGMDAETLAAAVERTVLLVRVTNWRFLATRDSAGLATFHTSLNKAMKAIAQFEALNTPNAKTLSQVMRAALTDYASQFDATAASLIALADLYTKVQQPMLADAAEGLEKAESSLALEIAAEAALALDVHDQATLAQGVITALGVAGGLALAFSIGRSISRPINGITGTMRALAGGDKTVVIAQLQARNEIGDMARAVDVFKSNMIEAAKVSAELQTASAARLKRQDSMDHHTKSFGKSVTSVMSSLEAASTNLRHAATTMTESTSAMHAQASETAGGANKSSEDLVAVAAAVEEFTASVGEISRQVSVAADVARQAVQRAEASQGTIQGLSDSTSRIGDVVRLIDSIAGQTNLLALNATIESARAGDAGKGFAVVAGEVKLLAGQTAQATAEISGQIESVRRATAETVAAMADIGSIIGRMGEVSAAIAAAVEEQSVTVREIAHSIQGVAGSTAQAANAMTQVVDGADIAGGASRNILVEANGIGAEAERLRNEVETFLSAVQEDSRERRRFERISGQGVTASMRIDGVAHSNVQIHDISHSGIALRHARLLPEGQVVEIDLPETGGVVTGKVIRASNGILAIGFNDDNITFSRVEHTLNALSNGKIAA